MDIMSTKNKQRNKLIHVQFISEHKAPLKEIQISSRGFRICKKINFYSLLFFLLTFFPNNSIFSQDCDSDGVLDVSDFCQCDVPSGAVNEYGCDFPAVCDFIEPADLNFTPSGLNGTAGYLTLYILTDSVGIMLDTSSAPGFSAVGDGKYMIIAIDYEDDASLANLVINDSLKHVTANCYELSNAVTYRICPTEICNDGIDNDEDGATDCEDSDCDVCDAFCGDIDGDGISEICDLDDDNDGIPDTEEMICDVADWTTNGYTAGGTDYQPSILGVGAVGTSSIDFIGVEVGTPSYDFLNIDNTIGGNGTEGVVFRGTQTTSATDAMDWTMDFSTTAYNVELYFGGVDVHDEIVITGFYQGNAVNISAANFSNYPNLTFTPPNTMYGPGDPASDLNTFDEAFFFSLPGPVDSLIFKAYKGNGGSGTVTLFISDLKYCIAEDTDSDGVANHLDLDSDNDGIFDVDEAGHTAADANDDGIIDGAAALFGTNGLFDALETVVDSDTINYTIADSETIPDGTYDPYELDSDGDTCYDVLEEGGSDIDSDGIVGMGIPTVDGNGLVTSITYTDPLNNVWQNPAIGPCLSEVCNDGIDNDADGDTDCSDSDCPVPSPTASANTPLCVGDNLGLNETSGDPNIVQWDWSGPSGFTATNLKNPGLGNVSLARAGNYIVTVTSSNGCTATSTINVTINDSPTATAGSNSSICVGEDLDLTETGGDGTGWSWSGPNSFTSSIQNPTISGASALAAGNYTVTVTDVNSCTSTSTVNVTIDPVPTATAGSNSSICVGEDLDLTETGGNGTGWSWSGPNSFTSSVQNPTISGASALASGTYTVTVTDGNSCTSTSTVNVTINTAPTATAGSNSSICVGEDLDLTETGGDGTGWSWSGPNSFTSSVQNPTISGASALASGTYTVTVTDGNSCTSTSTVNVTIDPVPTATAGSNSAICIGEDLDLTETGGDGTGWSWSGPNSFTSSAQNPTISGASALASGTYTVTVTNGNSCTSTSTVNVTVTAPQTATAGSNSPVCVGEDLDLTETGGDGTSWSWSGPNSFTSSVQNPTISGVTELAEGDYTVIITNAGANGCTATSTVSVVVNRQPTANVSNNGPICVGADLTLTETGTESVTWSWSGPNSFTSGIQSPTITAATIAANGTYTVTITDSNNCTSTETINATVIDLPNVTLNLPITETCETDTIALGGESPPGLNYSGTGVIGTSFDATVAGPGTHIITYTFTNANGCTNTATDNITVYDTPSITNVAGISPTTCSGTNGSITVTAVAGTGSLEYRINGGTWQSSNTFNGLDADSYTVEIQNDNGSCIVTNSSPVLLTDPTAPTAEINMPSAVCEGVTTNFTATDAGVGATYAWNFGSGATPATATGIGPHNVTYSTSGSKSISLNVTATNGCTASDAGSYTVYALPNVSLSLGDSEACVTEVFTTLSGGTPSGGTYSGTQVTGTNFNAAAAGVGTHTITYTYTDANGCVDTATDDIEVYALPTISLTLADDAACIDESSFNLSGGSPATGVYSGTGVSGGITFDPATAGLGPHTITYTITDPITNCVNSITDIITVNNLPSVTLSLGTDNACIDIASVALTGGSPATGTYSGSHVNSGTSSFDVAAAGVGKHEVTYTFTDANGCANSAIDSIEVFALPAVSLTLGTDEVCQNGASVALTGGTPSGGTYSGAHVNGVTELFDVVAAGVGTHSVTYSFTDGNGCVNSANANIEVLALPTVSLTLGDVAACLDEATIALSGGTPSGGTYSGPFVNGVTELFDVAAAGVGTHTITYTYTDGKNCINTATEDVIVYGYPSINSTTDVNPTTCSGLDGSITINASGGSGSYEYRVNGGSWQSSNIFGSLSAGPYNFEIRNDNGTCTTTYGSNPVTLSDPGSGLTVALNVTTDYLGYDITCFGAADASATAVASSGTAPYNYVWSNGQSGADLIDVPAGTYFVTVTDAILCEAIGSIEVTQPDQMLANAVVTNVSCYGGFDGEIDVNVTGGVNAFTYSWDDLSTEAFYAFDQTPWDQTGNGNDPYQFEGVLDYSTDRILGSHSFDFNGGTRIWFENQGTGFMASPFTYRTVLMWIKPSDLSGREILFEEGDGFLSSGIAIRLNDGNLEGVVRSWGGRFDATPVALDPLDSDGWYQVGFVYDDGDFSLVVNGVISPPENTTFGVIDAVISESGLGGSLLGSAFMNGFSEPTQYYEGLMDNVSYHTEALTQENISDVFDDDGDREGLPAGVYDVLISDFNGCNTTIQVTITQPDSLYLDTIPTEVSCFGGSDGQIDIVVNGGTAPFTYNWLHGPSSEDVTGLSIGTYFVTVTDFNSCSTATSVTIIQPEDLTLDARVISDYNGDDVTCPGDSDGIIRARARFGRSPYSFIWDTGDTTRTVENVSAGIYYVTTTDANGCTETANVTVVDPTSITVSTNINISYGIYDVSCANASDGEASVSASNGNSPYKYLWSNGDTLNVAENLAAGTYDVTVYDVNGCSAASSVTLDEPLPLLPTTTITSNYAGAQVSCPGDTDGSIFAEATGGNGSYTYEWSGTSFTGDSLINVGAGTYFVTISDDYCFAIDSVTIVNPTDVTPTITINSDYNGFDVSCNGGNDGDLTVSATGGVGGYSYEWDDAQTSTNITNAGVGDHTVTVTDANGCTGVQTITLGEPSSISFTARSQAPQDCGVDDGIITIDANGGTGEYQYSIDGGMNWQASEDFTGLAPGSYQAMVSTPGETCNTAAKLIEVDVTESPTIANLTIVHPTTGVSTDGAILVGATGINLSMEFRLLGETIWQGSSLFENLSVGTYTINVRYFGQNCIATATVELIAGNGVESTGSTLSFCSGDVATSQFVETYYIPAPENEILRALSSIYHPGCSNYPTIRGPLNPVFTYVSIGVVESGTIIHYDHWEDGYEDNLNFPIQESTEVWGDGNIDNGAPPGVPSDYLGAAQIIVLSNAVDTTTLAIVDEDWDGRDKIGSRGNLSVTRLAWADGSSTLFAGALEVYPKESWGTNYVIPVGEDINNSQRNQMFSYVGAVVMAERNGTLVNYIDNGVSRSKTLQEGESLLIDGNVNIGDSIVANNPIQVHLLTGDDCATYESRFFTLKPREQWSNNYYNPVSTLDNGSNDTEDYVNQPTHVHVFNPNSGSIDVRWETDGGDQGFISIAGGENEVFDEIPEGTGTRFYTVDGSEFYAIATIGSDPDGTDGNAAHDWGFALIPGDQLTSQITMVGFAPGQDPTFCTSSPLVPKGGWTVDSVSSEETVVAGHLATSAFDGDINTYWHTEYSGSTDPGHPHVLDIDMGTVYELKELRYTPRTGTPSSTTFASTDAPKAIIDDGTITSTLTIVPTGTITDLNINNLNITHSYTGDLEMSLTSPEGTVVNFMTNPCGSSSDINLNLDDEAGSGYPCSATGGGTYEPDNDLSAFDGEEMSGTWTLTITDVTSPDDGSLNSWGLQIENATAGNGGIEDYKFYLSTDGTNWGTPVTSGTFDNTEIEKRMQISITSARYIRLVAESEINGNPWASVAEIDAVQCIGSMSSENSAPIWITADFPPGSTSTGDVDVCVDHDGDGGSEIDDNGIAYDTTYVLSQLGQAKIYDNDDFDQTGTRIWVCDSTDAIIAGAWGQDPSTADTGSPAIDLGTGLPNGIPLSISKCANLSKDINSNGLFDECDEVEYTVMVRNTGALPLSTGSILITDTLPSELTYVDNSTVAIIGNTLAYLPDDVGPATVFPLDENGYQHNAIILPSDSIQFKFRATINNLPSATFVQNFATATSNGEKLQAEITFPVQTPQNPFDAYSPNDTTIACEAITVSAIQDTCLEQGLLPTAGWTLNGTNSEETISENGQAINAFDGDPYSFWHTEYTIDPDPTPPHYIEINLGATYELSGLTYLPRQVGSTNGRIADFEIYVSDDGSTWGAAVTSGTWPNSSALQTENFPTVSAQYIQLRALNEVNGGAWTSVAEIGVIGCISTTTFNEATTQTTDGTCTDESYLLTRTWTTTDYCGNVFVETQNITVVDTVAPALIDIPADIMVSSSTIPNPPVLDCNARGNLALGKPTSQSSTLGGGTSDRAVDGNTDGIYANNSVTQTDADAQAWWTVDLQDVEDIDSIRIYNRTDCCASNLSNFFILVSDEPFSSTNLGVTLADTKVSDYFQLADAGSPSIISIGRTGRYIRVQLQGTNNLSIAEFEVIPACISSTDNCDPDPVITFNETSIPTGCSYDIIRTWTATDNCGNSSSQTQTITVESALDIGIMVNSDYSGEQISCYNANDGEAIVTPTGGTDPISIAWSGGFSGTTVSTLSAGTYYITATDALGCIAIDSVTLTQPNPINISATVTSIIFGEQISCYNGNDGRATTNATGGTGNITYEWSTGATTKPISGLSAGTYTVTATDENDCTATASVTLNNPDELIVSTAIINPISCNGLTDASASATGVGGTGLISYEWDNGDNDSIAMNLTPGLHSVSVTDVNNCQIIASVDIIEPLAITYSIDVETDPTICEATDGAITLSATGGSGSYEYRLGAGGTWQASGSYTNLGSGTYNFYIRNDNGNCELGPIQIELEDPVPYACPITSGTGPYCNTDVSIPFSVVPVAGASGYVWIADSTMIVTSGQGTNAITLNANSAPPGSYDICVGTLSNCGNSSACCFTFNVISCVEICDNGIDDNGNGLVDCNDPSCGPTPNFVLPPPECINDTITFVATDLGAGVTYAWDFGTDATPATATGLGPHKVVYSTCGTRDIDLEATKGSCVKNETKSISITDTEDPTFLLPNDTTLYLSVLCDVDTSIASVGSPTNIADNCSIDLTASYSDNLTNLNACNTSGILRRAWTVIDDCGNVTTQTQLITISDDLDPTADPIANLGPFACYADIPAADINVVLNEDDNCNGAVTVSFVGDGPDPGCSGTVTRTYRLTDACGNTTDLTQTITINDNVGPTADPLSGIGPFNCQTDIPAANTALVINEADNCGGIVTVTHVGDNRNPGCATDFIRTYRLADACGNNTDITQVISMNPIVTNTGALTVDSTTICLSPTLTGVIGATPDGNAVIPCNYSLLYILSEGAPSIIMDTSSTPNFNLTNAGDFVIHTLIYNDVAADPNFLDLSTINFGVTPLSTLVSSLEQGGGNICAALDMTGAAATAEVCSSSLGDFVWQDDNGDGIQTLGEPGIPGVTIRLYTMANVLVNTTTSGVTGAYSFPAVSAGTYYVVFDVSTNTNGLTTYLGTTQNVGSPITDSDVNPATGRSPLFLFNPALGNILTLDAGYIISCPPTQRGGVNVTRH